MGAVRLMTKEAEEALFLVAEARLFGGITCPKMEESHDNGRGTPEMRKARLVNDEAYLL